MEPASTSIGNTYSWRNDATPSYGGGTGINFNNVAWNDVSDDKVFSMNGGSFTGTLCTLGDAINKAGKNASASGKNIVNVENFVREAQSIIDAVTRFKWVAGYSEITTEKKFILNQVCSDMAGLDIIMHDMTNYKDATAEAETMVNVLREKIARGLSLLRNQEIKDFIVKTT